MSPIASFQGPARHGLARRSDHDQLVNIKKKVQCHLAVSCLLLLLACLWPASGTQRPFIYLFSQKKEEKTSIVRMSNIQGCGRPVSSSPSIAIHFVCVFTALRCALFFTEVGGGGGVFFKSEEGGLSFANVHRPASPLPVAKSNRIRRILDTGERFFVPNFILFLLLLLSCLCVDCLCSAETRRRVARSRSNRASLSLDVVPDGIQSKFTPPPPQLLKSLQLNSNSILFNSFET